jgi:hypothetical protein
MSIFFFIAFCFAIVPLALCVLAVGLSILCAPFYLIGRVLNMFGAK